MMMIKSMDFFYHDVICHIIALAYTHQPAWGGLTLLHLTDWLTAEDTVSQCNHSLLFPPTIHQTLEKALLSILAAAVIG